MFCSQGRQEDFPANRWSNALIQYLQNLTTPLVLLMMEDYWLTRPVDAQAINWLGDYMQGPAAHDVARMDLTSDRLYATGSRDIGSLHRLDLLEGSPHAEYTMSMQAGIWNREALLQLLRPNESPWETEMRGSVRMKDSHWRVLGTRQTPMRYLIAVRGGVFSMDGSWQSPPKQLTLEDTEELIHSGWLP
jgi:hypothetical protein